LFTDYENISVIETRIVDSYQDALEHFKEKRREGLEGTIVKSLTGVWNPKRVKYQAKFKAMYEGDFKVTGWEYGSGKNSDKVGNLKCETSDGLVKFNVGIFKDFPSDIREKWLKECPPIVTVRYNERIKSKGREDGVESLFLPRVILERWDKSTCDSREDLIKMEEATLK
jgi:DNA ligase-1